MDSRCSGTNREGGACNAEVRPGRAWCRWHDPDLEDERAEWRRKGGQARSNAARAGKLARAAQIKTIPELQRLLSKAIDDALAGQVQATLLNAVAGAAKAIVDLGQAHELEERLAALEAAAGLSDRRLA
jgi:hypothetical protein